MNDSSTYGVFKPGKEYKVGIDAPTGYYILSNAMIADGEMVSPFSGKDACMRLFEKGVTSFYPHRRYTAYWGLVAITDNYDRFLVEGGYAVYYGEETFDLLEVLKTTELADGESSSKGQTVFVNEILQVSVLKRDSREYLYHGETDMVLSDQFWFSVNGHHYWAGLIDGRTYKAYYSVKICLKDKTTGKRIILDDEKHCAIGYLSCAKEDSGLYLARVITDEKNEDFFIAALPDRVQPKETYAAWLQPSFCHKKLTPSDETIREKYSKRFTQLAAILEQYCDLGLEIDVDKELQHFCDAPDFAVECTNLLKQYLAYKEVFDKKAKTESEYITFRVGATYDKKFYCAAKLADKACDVTLEETRPVYHITFRGDQTEEIQLMYFNLLTAFNHDRDDLMKAAAYLKENDFFTYLQDAIDGYIADNREKNGYSRFVNSSPLITIIKAINRYKRRELTRLYAQMVKENRVNTKWSSEYRLYALVKKYATDAEYQYRIAWLGQQSFDIFIPSQNIAIEYQGLQHYESVDAFGGDEALLSNQERDMRKRKLSEENGVTLLEWKYDTRVSDDAVLDFLKSNGVAISEAEHGQHTQSDSDSPGLEMAPVIENKIKAPAEKVPVKRESKYVVRQFDRTGKFIEEFISLTEASEKSGASEKSITKAIYGEHRTGGGYIWRRCLRGDEINDVEPVEISVTTHEPQAVLQYDLDGNFVAQYESIGKAAKAVGVDRKGISSVLIGRQRTAGGFIWKVKQGGIE